MRKNIHQRTIEENPDNLYWSTKWPKYLNKEEQKAVDFLVKQYPNTISIGVQKVADLLVAYKKQP